MTCLRFLVQILIIFSVSNFLSAQILDYATAQVPTLWRNNNDSAVNVTKPSNGASGPYMRIILLKQTDDQVGFACGFLSGGNDNTFAFAIGVVRRKIVYYYDYSEFLWTDFELVWLANRNHPVHENGTLSLLADGNLVLRDANGTLVWSTNTSGKSVISIMMTETGNLVLYDSYNTTIWQSFDHPSVALLDGQKLMAGQKLVAGVSSNNWGEGNYCLTVTSQGLFAFYQSNIQELYFKFLVRGTRKSIQTSYVKAVNGTLVIYISSIEPNEPDAVFSKPSGMLYMKLDYDGYFRVYRNHAERVDLLADFLTKCDYPLVCCSYGICSNGACSCPAGFSVSNNGSGGCSEISPKICKNSESQGLLHLTDVYYFSYIDPNAAVLKTTDIERCKQVCLKNCSCKVALFQYFYNVSQGTCFLPSPVHSFISDGKSRILYQSSAFIKISSDDNNPTNGSSSLPMSAGRVVLIAGSSIGGLVLAGMAIVIYVVVSRKRTKYKDDDDFLDQLSGMPLRFTYEELKSATENFQVKLGEGGFGSVFAGTLRNREKIGVKRLDGLGQGKKEFLAEVKTIGSIHHVNLVRLIGFCAESNHRLLVYEYMCNGSLDKWIFCKSLDQVTLDWQQRKLIILDIAKGLAYLHEECRQMILHLDIKPQNILLDTNLRAKVSDFGLSKLIDKGRRQTVTTMRGTPGYLAPEWLTSVITDKVDVYSFGVVVMEMVTGRKNLDWSQSENSMQLLSLVEEKAKENQLIELIDKTSDDMQLHATEAVRMMRLGAWCLQHAFSRRPSMSIVVKVLEGSMDIEHDLIYNFWDPRTVQALRQDSGLCGTSTLLPSILSGPR